MNRAWIAHAALLIVAALYGANYLVAKGLMPDKIGPSGFIVFRVLGALVLFGAMYLFKPEKIQKKHIGRFILCGLAGVASNQLLFFNGLNLTSPVHASIIMTINPVLVMIMGAVILKLAITKRQILGLVIGGVGAIAMLILGAQENVREASLEGNLMVLLNAASYAVYLVLAKPLMSSYRAVTVIFYVFLFGSLFVLPIGASQALAVDFASFESQHWIGLGYVILGTTFLAYLLNIFALQKVQPTVVSVYIYLQPIMTAFFALVFAAFGAADHTGALTLPAILCTVLIFVGVYLVSFKRKKQKTVSSH